MEARHNARNETTWVQATTRRPETMNSTMNIAVLYPSEDEPDNYQEKDLLGREGEEHITALVNALKALGHNPLLIPMNMQAIDSLREKNIDLAFNLCDSGFMNKAQLEPHVCSMLELLRIPYTGSDAITLATSIDKARCKKIMIYHNIPTANFQLFATGHEKISKALRFPCIVKPNHEHASIGIDSGSVVHDEEQLVKKVQFIIKEYGQPALVEEYIEGREVHSFLVGSGSSITILPFIEISFSKVPEGTPHIFTYDAKWNKESEIFSQTPYVCPARLDKAMEQKIRDIAVQTYQVMQVQDYGRVDFRIDDAGEVFVLEVNPNPYLAAEDYLGMILDVAGMTYARLVEMIIESAVKRSKQRNISRIPAGSPSALNSKSAPFSFFKKVIRLRN